MRFFGYVLRSLEDGKLYTGMSPDVDRRLRDHNSGKTRSLRHRRPLVLVYKEVFETRSEAIAREYYLKTAEGGALKQRLVAESEKRHSGPSAG
jgi:putative endonuclease